VVRPSPPLGSPWPAWREPPPLEDPVPFGPLAIVGDAVRNAVDGEIVRAGSGRRLVLLRLAAPSLFGGVVGGLGEGERRLDDGRRPRRRRVDGGGNGPFFAQSMEAPALLRLLLTGGQRTALVVVSRIRRHIGNESRRRRTAFFFER